MVMYVSYVSYIQKNIYYIGYVYISINLRIHFFFKLMVSCIML